MSSGYVLRRTSGVTLAWADEEHFDRAENKSCRRCATPTRMRDDDGEPCHIECAEQQLAAAIAAERFGSCSEHALTQELTGHAVPLAPEVRR
jgi:hypothetical protein